MPSSKFLIASNTLGSSAASVTFSNIPATYEDLILLLSTRALDLTIIEMKLNGATSTYSNTLLLGNGTNASSTKNTGQSYLRVGYINSDSNNANTFSTGEIYIPKYRSTTDKPISSIGYTEANGTTAYIANYANLWQTSSAVTSITLEMAGSSSSFVSGSSFWLYGLKSS